MRLIDAHLAQHIADEELSVEEAGIVQWVLSHTPTIKEKRGRWLHIGTGEWCCSECKTLGSPHWKRCPVCEAKMDAEKVTE